MEIEDAFAPLVSGYTPGRGKLPPVLLVVSFIIFLFFPFTLAAQTIPKAAEPGKLKKQFQEQVRPTSVFEPVIPDTDGKPMPPNEAEKITFVLSGISLDGNTVYSPEKLEPLYEQYLWQSISLRQVYEIAEAITTQYHNDGYIQSHTVVEPQKIENGLVHIRVIEGYIK
ncbi:MAG: hypothetical protein KQH63_11130 [Desulfobulbaceae bacterium]|nr:hypothetical protein [Desulfobulbaceae bacterium]